MEVSWWLYSLPINLRDNWPLAIEYEALWGPERIRNYKKREKTSCLCQESKNVHLVDTASGDTGWIINAEIIYKFLDVHVFSNINFGNLNSRVFEKHVCWQER